MNIVVIGGGWYGCYISLLLQKKHNVLLIEKNNSIFEGASYYNQNRLHLGYHYPRNYNTRQLCSDGYNKFVSTFPDLIYPVNKNYYLLSKHSSLDYNTIKSIYRYEKYEYKEIKNEVFHNIDDTMMMVNECMIDNKKSKLFFLENLHCNQKMNVTVTEIHDTWLNAGNEKIHFDLLIDCTYNSLQLSKKQYIYEKTISLLFKQKKHVHFDAITVIDGKFFSLYPHDIENKIFTLTDVEFTPLISSFTLKDIQNYIVSDAMLDEVKYNMIQKVTQYYKEFEFDFEYVGYFTSNKTKIISNCDSRECNIEKNGNKISINCGKITGIFKMEEYFNDII